MNIEFVRQSDSFSKPYLIFIDSFTEEDRNTVLTVLQPYNATVVFSTDLIMVTCKDEATYNWLLLKWQQYQSQF